MCYGNYDNCEILMKARWVGQLLESEIKVELQRLSKIWQGGEEKGHFFPQICEGKIRMRMIHGWC